MANDVEGLKQKLLQSPSARAAFLADTLSLLKTHGVNVDDPNVQKQLGLNFNLTDGQQFLKNMSASSIAITITA
jgi:hypothetical protein